MRAFFLTVLVLSAGLVSATAGAQTFYVATDVPTDLGPVTLFPWAVSRGGSGPWSTDLTLPAGTEIAALHRLGDGDWLFAVATPGELGGMAVEPRDVVRADVGGVFSLFLDGDVDGMPGAAVIDALHVVDPATLDVVVSFAAPVEVAGATFEPADLVRFSGGVFSLVLDASETTPPIPSTANITAAARLGAAWVFALDTPTTLGEYTFLPGQLIAWDGAFTVLHGDAGWPLSSRVNALSFLAGPGATPANLRIDKVPAPGGVALSWNTSCSIGAEDYAIYEGTIGHWYSHLPVSCSDTAADLREDLAPGAGDRYFIVVPRNANEEGSYGVDYRSGVFGQRPQPFSKSDRCVGPQGVAACF